MWTQVLICLQTQTGTCLKMKRGTSLSLKGMISMASYEKIFKAAKNNNRAAFRKLFLRLHVKDQGDLFQALYPQNQKKVEQFLEPNEFAELFEWMDPLEQKNVYEVFSDTYIATLFPYMEVDNVVKFLGYLTHEEQNKILSLLEADDRDDITKMLLFKSESSGSVMNKSYVTGLEKTTVRQALEDIRESAKDVEMIYYIYVLNEEGILKGVASLRDLMVKPQNQTLEEIMITQVAFVNVDIDQEIAARLLQKYNLIAIPVLDAVGKMVGLITVDDVMDILEEETTEDFNEFAGISRKKSKDVEDGVWGVARMRMPWIIILIFMGMISASLIGSFENTLNEVVLLAAFIPIITDAAGNVGTQSLAVAVRKISMGETSSGQSIGKILLQEFFVGAVLGLAAGSVLGLIVAIFYGNTILAIAIGISLLITLSISNVVGAVIPVLINKLNIDPAVASGPFITTINDLIGLFIYFSIATQIIHLL